MQSETCARTDAFTCKNALQERHADTRRVDYAQLDLDIFRHAQTRARVHTLMTAIIVRTAMERPIMHTENAHFSIFRALCSPDALRLLFLCSPYALLVLSL